MSSRSYRKRKKSSCSAHDSDEELPSKVSEIKEVQKFRCKRGGINAVSLAVGRIVSTEETLTGNVFGKAATSKQTDSQQEKYGLQVGNVFSAESNHREEDQLMNHYIKEELAKRRGDNYYFIFMINFYLPFNLTSLHAFHSFDFIQNYVSIANTSSTIFLVSCRFLQRIVKIHYNYSLRWSKRLTCISTHCSILYD